MRIRLLYYWKNFFEIRFIFYLRFHQLFHSFKIFNLFVKILYFLWRILNIIINIYLTIPSYLSTLIYQLINSFSYVFNLINFRIKLFIHLLRNFTLYFITFIRGRVIIIFTLYHLRINRLLKIRIDLFFILRFFLRSLNSFNIFRFI